MRSASLPAWLGWVAIPLGVVAVTPIGWIVLLFAVPLWSLIVSVLVFLRQAAPAAAARSGHRLKHLGGSRLRAGSFTA